MDQYASQDNGGKTEGGNLNKTGESFNPRSASPPKLRFAKPSGPLNKHDKKKALTKFQQFNIGKNKSQIKKHTKHPAN